MVFVVFRCCQSRHKCIICLTQDLRKVPVLHVVDLPTWSL